ncbi:MAG: ABC transporter ATP-binding protein [Gammaproteobacteria bacterium]
MSNIAIEVVNIGKKYRVNRAKPGVGYGTLRESFSNMMALPKKLFNKHHRHNPVDDYWALRHINFSVQEGEVFGLIGRNGAGKSTLLKILSRVTEPTEGHIHVCGKMGSLLEVGFGFHPELTGRENVFLSGKILGMNKKEIAKKFDEIIHFSEVADFIDTPVKHYSSGMYARLSFSVAAHFEPDIIVIDEVLSVGDKAFRKKCMNKMHTIAQQGCTVIFVSHDMESVQRLCHRVCFLKEGRIENIGPTEKVLQDYLSQLDSQPQYSTMSSQPELTME